MNTALHHTRLALAVEFADPPPLSVLDRDAATELGTYVAADLARVAPDTRHGFLTVSAALLDAADILRPGFGAYTVLESLAQQSGAGDHPGQIMSIGGSNGRMPRAELMPRTGASAQLMLLPLVLTLSAAQGPACRRTLEEILFDQGGAHPPTLASLAEHSGGRCVHAQLVTLFDLIALNRVQLNAAGLGAAAEVLQHALLQPDESMEFRHDAGLTLRWHAPGGHAQLQFLTLEQWQTGNRDTGTWLQWLRALRQTESVLRSHGLAVTFALPPGTGDDTTLEQATESVRVSRPCDDPDNTIVHHHPELGVLAWTETRAGTATRHYPLSEAAARRARDLQPRPRTTTSMAWPGTHHHDDTP